jgi:hypothetical protein
MATKNATKKAAPKPVEVKKAAPKPVEVKKAAPKPAKAAGMKKGSKYSCSVCGLVVSVDNLCGCSTCDILCCGKPMKVKK